MNVEPTKPYGVFKFLIYWALWYMLIGGILGLLLGDIGRGLGAFGAFAIVTVGNNKNAKAHREWADKQTKPAPKKVSKE